MGRGKGAVPFPRCPWGGGRAVGGMDRGVTDARSPARGLRGVSRVLALPETRTDSLPPAPEVGDPAK